MPCALQLNGFTVIYFRHKPWWRHQMETFSALLALCAGNPPVTGGFPLQRPVTRSVCVFFDLRLYKRLSRQSRRRLFETLCTVCTLCFVLLWLWYSIPVMHMIYLPIFFRVTSLILGNLSPPIIWLPQYQWINPERYGLNLSVQTTTKLNEARAVCLFLGMRWIHIVRIQHISINGTNC